MRLKVFVCVLIGLIVLGSAPSAIGEAGSVVYTFGSAFSDNESKYTLYFSVPPVIQVGVKTNFTFYVYLTELSGWKIQSQRQIFQMTINTATATIVTEKATNNVTLYQGGRWGPFNMTVLLTDSQAGLPPGGVENATVFANLVVYEQYDNPQTPYLVDDGTTLKVTDVKLAATPGSPSFTGDRLLVSIAIGTTVVVAAGGLALATRRKGHPDRSSQRLDATRADGRSRREQDIELGR